MNVNFLDEAILSEAKAERRGLEQTAAGLAMQAYVPDTARWQRVINEWARKRVAAGGAPVTIRLVKGANMEMERIEAAIKGWPQAPFKTKRETDANYKRMLHEGMKPENLAAVPLNKRRVPCFTRDQARAKRFARLSRACQPRGLRSGRGLGPLRGKQAT